MSLGSMPKADAIFPILQELAERELILLRETEIWRDPLAKIRA